MDCNEVQDLLEGYVLDALSQDEQEQVERHLATCADCQRQLAEYRAVTALLPAALAAASPARPPAALKDRILQAIDAPVAQTTPTASLESHGKVTNHFAVPPRNR